MRLRLLIAWLVAGACLAAPAAARIPKLAADARVRSVTFRFIGHHELKPADFEPVIVTSAPSTLDRITEAVSWIPFVPDPHPHPFSPVVLQQDLERVRRTLAREGFLSASADYEVDVAENRRDVKVTFIVREGEPTRIRSLALAGSARADTIAMPDTTALPDSLARTCATAWRGILRGVGERPSTERLEAARKALSDALGNDGYPAPRLAAATTVDSSRNEVDIVWIVTSGPRVRLAEVSAEGVKSVPEATAVRQLGLEPGVWYSRRDFEQSRMLLQSVPLFQRSNVVLVPPASPDSGAAVRAVIQETSARLTNLEVGYVTDGAGITSQARWTHPNLTGGARSFDAIGLVQTGWWATGEPDQLLRATFTLTQPYVGSPRYSLNGGPSIERRDGRVDRSVSTSLTATLVYRINALQSAALRYDWTYRQLQELKIPGLISAAVDSLAEIPGLTNALIDSLKQPDRIPQLVFFTSLGHLDDIARPRHGLVFKPNLAVTVPPSWGTVNFGKADAQLTMFAPMPGPENALMLRGTAGAVWPFGASVPGPGLGPAVEWYRLRDQVLKAGGATDVRGYASELLGPKYPVIDEQVNGTDTVLTSSTYAPIGGLRRVTATAELRIAIPRFGRSIFGHLFTDAGRVWTTDERFRLNGLIAPDEERMFYTWGGGVGYYTPVGAIRFDLGYKLNPSTYDLRRPDEVLRAVAAGLPASAAPVHESQRYAFHFSLGLFF